MYSQDDTSKLPITFNCLLYIVQALYGTVFEITHLPRTQQVILFTITR